MKLVTLILYLLMYLAPFGFMMLDRPLADSNFENRELNAWPLSPKSVAEIKAYPLAVSRYFEDHFAFRNVLINSHNQIALAFNQSPVDSVIVGKNDWLFSLGMELLRTTKIVSLIGKTTFLRGNCHCRVNGHTLRPKVQDIYLWSRQISTLFTLSSSRFYSEEWSSFSIGSTNASYK